MRGYWLTDSGFLVSAATILSRLLLEQREHDERAHRDVYYLSYPRRLTHLTLHLAKYSGRLAGSGAKPELVSRTLVDSFIIALSAAELLRLDIPASLLVKGIEPDEVTGLEQLGGLLARGYPESTSVVDWYFRQLATHAGRLAKALESLDHLERLEYRRMMEESVAEVLIASLVAASGLRLDLAKLARERWMEFEAGAFRRGEG